MEAAVEAPTVSVACAGGAWGTIDAHFDSTTSQKLGIADQMGKRETVVTSLSGVGLALLGLLAPLIIPSNIPEWLLHGAIGFSLGLATIPWIFGRETSGAGADTVKKAIYDRRRHNIDACRALIAGWFNHSPIAQLSAMEDLPEYQALRGHFTAAFFAQLRRKETIIKPDMRPYFMSLLASELDRIERKWGMA
ncbi:hypothetical protein [Sphingopyxis sp.]|uniref:hypothetical protein n=1 Tax=Sphingopyxis sp. TaxID=1908224 RepID=UPI001DCF25FD|nr:hypothetical protein [Sphingopyxis sp.]MBW8296163.1 hypothetical protein [Sphingopyxis sp.]